MILTQDLLSLNLEIGGVPEIGNRKNKYGYCSVLEPSRTFFRKLTLDRFLFLSLTTLGNYHPPIYQAPAWSNEWNKCSRVAELTGIAELCSCRDYYTLFFFTAANPIMEKYRTRIAFDSAGITRPGMPCSSAPLFLLSIGLVSRMWYCGSVRSGRQRLQVMSLHCYGR